MCKQKEKLTDEQKLAKKIARREKRSAFLSRMVDEFKKIILIVMYPTVVGFLVWEHIIYEKGVTPTFPSTITVALITGLFGTIIAYCITSYKEKDSLNKNGHVNKLHGDRCYTCSVKRIHLYTCQLIKGDAAIGSFGKREYIFN